MHVYEIEKDGSWRFILSVISPEIGFEKGLPEKSIIGEYKSSGCQEIPENFLTNPKFFDFLNETIRKHASYSKDVITTVSKIKEGIFEVVDERNDNISRLDEDTIGAFKVEDGNLIVNSYQPNPNYKLVGSSGQFNPPIWLKTKLEEDVWL